VTKNTIISAAHISDLDVAELQFLYESGKSIPLLANMMHVIMMSNGNLDCLKYIVEKDATTTLLSGIADEAAHCGNVEIIKYLQSLNYCFDNRHVLISLTSNRLECAKYLMTTSLQVLPYDEIIKRAATHGHLTIVNTVFEKSSKIARQKSLLNACMNSHVDIVEYLLNHGILLNANQELGIGYSRPGIAKLYRSRAT
jgi:hypothetical protein